MTSVFLTSLTTTPNMLTHHKSDTITHTLDKHQCIWVHSQTQYLKLLADLKDDIQNRNRYHCLSQTIVPGGSTSFLTIGVKNEDEMITESPLPYFYLFMDFDPPSDLEWSTNFHMQIAHIFIDTLHIFGKRENEDEDDDENQYEKPHFFVYVSQKFNVPGLPAKQYSKLHIHTKILVRVDEARLFSAYLIDRLESLLPLKNEHGIVHQWQKIVDNSVTQDNRINCRMNYCTNVVKCTDCFKLRHNKERVKKNSKTLSSRDGIVCPRDSQCTGKIQDMSYYRVSFVLDEKHDLHQNEFERIRQNKTDEWLATAIRFHYVPSEFEMLKIDRNPTIVVTSSKTGTNPKLFLSNLRFTIPKNCPSTLLTFKRTDFVTSTGEIEREVVPANKETRLALKVRDSYPTEYKAKKNRHEFDQMEVIIRTHTIFDIIVSFIREVNHELWAGIEINQIKVLVHRDKDSRDYYITTQGPASNICLGRMGNRHKLMNCIWFKMTPLGVQQRCRHFSSETANRENGVPCSQFRSEIFPLPSHLKQTLFVDFMESKPFITTTSDNKKLILPTKTRCSDFYQRQSARYQWPKLEGDSDDDDEKK